MRSSDLTPTLFILVFALVVPALPQSINRNDSAEVAVPIPCCGGQPVNGKDSDESQRPVRLHHQELLKFIVTRTALLPPSNLHNSKLHGKVTVEVCIDQTGAVANVRAVKGHPFAMSSALYSVSKWTFTPYLQRGKAKCAIGLLTLDYDFRGRAHKSSSSSQ